MVPRDPQDTTVHRGISPIVGSVILIVIVLLLGATVGAMTLGLTNQVPRSNPQMAVQWENSNAGLVVIPRSMTDDVDLKINGKTVTTISESDLNQEILLPVAPNDRVGFVGDAGPDDMLVQKRVREREAGDFIAYYTFEKQSGSTVLDRSSNDNDASLMDDPKWVKDNSGTGLQFDGSGDYVKVDQLNTKNTTDVDEFTVAVKFRIEGDTGDIQQLVEHRNSTTGFEWFLETQAGNMPYKVEYNVWPNGNNPPGIGSGQHSSGSTHVAVGTFDEDTMKLYIDGDYIGSKQRSGTIEMGALYVGADAVMASSQHFKGRMYQLRLYYTAMDEGQVQMLTDVMEAEAE